MENVDIFSIVAEEDQRVRYHNIVKENEAVPQGDVYLVRIADMKEGRKALERMLSERWSGFKFGKIGQVTTVRQLVSDNTMGSRHVVEGDGVTIFGRSHEAHALEGPVIVADSRFTLAHPEHAHHSIPEGTYQVIYQRDWAFEEAQRVAD